MRKKTIILISLSLILPISVLAIENPLSPETDFAKLIQDIIDFLKDLVVPLAGIMFVIAGYLFLTAIGNPSQIGQARRALLFTIIGILVILLAEALRDTLKSWFS